MNSHNQSGNADPDLRTSFKSDDVCSSRSGDNFETLNVK